MANVSTLGFLLFIMAFFRKYPLPKLFSPATFIIVLILYTWLVSAIRNQPQEWIPSLLRFVNYGLVFYVTYWFFKYNQISIHHVSFVVTVLLVIAVLGGFYEILTGQVKMANGAYRVSGHYDHHYLGYAMLMFVLLSYSLNVQILGNSNPLGKLFHIILFACGMYMFINSHSRMLTVSFFATNFMAYILTTGNIKRVLYSGFVFLVFMAIAYYLVMFTELFPRIREMLMVKRVDHSTLYRIFIIKSSTDAMSFLDYLVGIGMGGFNMFFYRATGEDEVAAHNDYLLWLVEGGAAMLLFYIIFQYKVVREVIRKSKRAILKSPTAYRLGVVSFVLFVGIEIFGFLLNPHYFYQSENVIFFVMGAFLGRMAYISSKERQMATQVT